VSLLRGPNVPQRDPLVLEAMEQLEVFIGFIIQHVLRKILTWENDMLIREC